jgi:hypothetical protein
LTVERDATSKIGLIFRPGVTLSEPVSADGIEPPTAGV